MRLIKQFIMTCKAEGARKAIVRSVAQVLGVKVVGFAEKDEENELCVKYHIPRECVQTPLLMHSSIKHAMLYEPEKTQKLINTCYANSLVDYVKAMNAYGMEIYPLRKEILERALLISNNENYYEHLAYAVINQWEWEGPTDLLFERCEVLINRLARKEEVLLDIYMIYISSLIEIDRVKEAKKVLTEYVKTYGKQRIHLYYPVSELALEIGVINKKIEEAAHICKVLCKNKNLLIEHLKGKSVAVVGSGPGEIGKGKGEEIDTYDEVIRFNDFRTEGYENDYGSKTTIWVRNTDVENGGCNPRNEEIERFSLIILETDIWRFQIPEVFLDTFYKYATKALNKFCMLQYRDEMVHEMGSFPTSGGLMLYNLLKIQKDDMNIYGFSFTESEDFKVKKIIHYNKKNYLESNLHHNINIEMQFLKEVKEHGIK